MHNKSLESSNRPFPGEDPLSSMFREFAKECPTEEKAVEIVASRIDHSQPKCSNCPSKDIDLKEGQRSYRCRRCKKATWRTAGTLFHGVRYTRPLLALTWLMEKGFIVSAWRLSQLTGIAYSSAWATIKKLMLAIEKDMHEELPEVRSLLFRQAIYKRSRETQTRQHPQSEEIEQPQEQAQKEETLQREIKERQTLIDRLDAEHKHVYEQLSDEPVDFDMLHETTGLPSGTLSAMLLSLQLDGLVKGISGNSFLRTELSSSKPTLHNGNGTIKHLANELRQAIAGFIQTSRDHFHGISRKYLQLFLAGQWCTTDRERWPEGALFELCAATEPIKYAAIIAYVSPFMVKIGTAPQAQAGSIDIT
ncbi:MAG TPA: hypothetical protein V6D22_01900 [Candidatus Obscuribacterales bacterium]